MYDSVTLTSDLWSWTFAVYRLWRDETLYQIWTQSSNPRRSYCDFSVWPYDLDHCVTCSARLWNNIHQVWPSTTYPCLNYSIFWCWYLCHSVTLTFDPLTLKFAVHKASRDQGLSEIEQSSTELLKFCEFLHTLCHAQSRCDLDLWPLHLELLQRFGCHAFKLCTKFERNPIIHRWVIDDLARFRRAIIGGGARLTNGSQGYLDPTSPNWREHRAISHTQEICFSVRIYCCIFKRGRLKFEWW